MLDFVAGAVLVAAALVELDRPGPEPLSMAYALGLLGLIHMMRGAGQVLKDDDAQGKNAMIPRKSEGVPILTFKPPKALPPPLPDNILSMEEAKCRRIKRRQRREEAALSALTKSTALGQMKIQAREEA